MLQFICPVFVLVFSALLFHQKMRRADVVAVLFTLLGVSLFFFDKLSPGNMLGNVIALMAGFFMALMYLFMGNGDESTRMSGIFLGHIITALVGVPFAFFTTTALTTTTVVSILALGIFQLGIPYVLYGISAKRCPVLMVSLISAIEPLLNPVWVFLFDGEAPGLFALLGGVVVILSVTLWCVWKEKHPDTAEDAGGLKRKGPRSKAGPGVEEEEVSLARSGGWRRIRTFLLLPVRRGFIPVRAVFS